MRIFGKKKFATPRDCGLVCNNIMKMCQQLQFTILSYDWKEKNNINLNANLYILFLYDSVFYRIVMTLKNSNFYIETVFRTIFITIEKNNKKQGIQITKNQLWEMFVGLSARLEEIGYDAEIDGVSKMKAVAIYLLKMEFFLTDEEINKNYVLVEKVSDHFSNIMNISIDKI